MRTERTEDGGGRLLVFNGDQEEFLFFRSGVSGIRSENRQTLSIKYTVDGGVGHDLIVSCRTTMLKVVRL